MRGRSWLAVVAGVLALLALFDAALAIGLVQLELLPPLSGFRFFNLALLQALIALPLGLVGLLRTAGGVRSGRGLAWLGVLGGGALVAIVGAQLLAVRDLPVINDVSTDTADPPAFVAAASEPELAGVDLAYPAGFAALQRSAYPKLAPIRLDASPPAAYQRALASAEALGWEVVARDASALRFEAREPSALFRFVDDVVVRVRPAADGAGAVVDVRSRSRDGRSDLGVNAARIDAFAKRLGD